MSKYLVYYKISLYAVSHKASVTEHIEYLTNLKSEVRDDFSPTEVGIKAFEDKLSSPDRTQSYQKCKVLAFSKIED